MLSMPVIDSLYNSDYHDHKYIPSVSAVIEYIDGKISRNINLSETNAELIVYDI
jgi:hypothetical protein